MEDEGFTLLGGSSSPPPRRVTIGPAPCTYRVKPETETNDEDAAGEIQLVQRDENHVEARNGFHEEEKGDGGRDDRIAYVTGGLGLLGHAVIKLLVRDGRRVRAVVADPDQARNHLPWRACELVRGDICDREALERTMDGCAVVYHCDELMEQWVNDRKKFEQRNVIGTRNVVEVAMALRVEKFVFASSVYVFDYKSGVPFDETAGFNQTKYTDYERTKKRADAIVSNACTEGLPAVFLHPALLYGPGPFLTYDSLNFFLLQLFRQITTTIPPGGAAVVFCEDAARGLILAEQIGEIGARYILSEGYYPLEEIFQSVSNVAGFKDVRPSVLPGWAALAFSVAGEAWASTVSGRPPPLPQGQLRLLESQVIPSSSSSDNNNRALAAHNNNHNDGGGHAGAPSRASEYLGWTPTPLYEGLHVTMDFFAYSGLLKPRGH